MPARKRRAAAVVDGSPEDRLAAAVAADLAAACAPHPAFGAACCAARGRAGWLDRAAWAGALDVADPVIAAAEAGVLDPVLAPRGLVAAADRAWPDWRRWQSEPGPDARPRRG
jgi:hypothetical protein